MANIIIQGKELYHHGILGMHWGVRRYQNADGTLTEAGKKRLQKKDVKWAHKNYNKIYKDSYNKSRRELNDYVENDLNKRVPMYNANRKISLQYANEFNKKMAEIMTKNASEYTAPSGKAVKFIAKRGEVGVHMILAEQEFNTQLLKNGVYASGKIAYKGQNVEMA